MDPIPYWGFDDLNHLLGVKLLNCFYVHARVEKRDGAEWYHYAKIKILAGFSFDNFLSELRNGDVYVDFDARTGHNHGTKFRAKSGALEKFYSVVTEISEEEEIPEK